MVTIRTDGARASAVEPVNTSRAVPLHLHEGEDSRRCVPAKYDHCIVILACGLEVFPIRANRDRLDLTKPIDASRVVSVKLHEGQHRAARACQRNPEYHHESKDRRRKDDGFQKAMGSSDHKSLMCHKPPAVGSARWSQEPRSSEE